MKDIVLGVLGYDNIMEFVLRDLRWALNNRNSLEQESYPREILGYLVEVIITRGFWRMWPKHHLIKRLKSLGFTVVDDRIVVGLEEFDQLLRAVNDLFNETRKRYWQESLLSLQALSKGLRKAGSLKKWINTLYIIISNGNEWRKHEYFKGIKGLGRKSVELILRDMGYFDRIPVDIHERRFTLRTGIALIYGPSNKDPIQPEFYSEALKRYCKENLRDIELEGISLESAPGILDWAIWYFSCEKESKDCRAICSSNPKCDKCPIRDMCLYGRIHQEKIINNYS